MLKIAIIDDDKIIRDQLGYYIESEYPFQYEIEFYSNGRALMHDVKNGIHVFDLFIMDIRMPWLDGISASRALLELNVGAPVILISQYSEYILEGYDVRAFNFLIKPITKNRFIQVFERATRELDSTKIKTSIVQRTLKEVRYIPVKDIVYIESNKRITTVVTADRMRSSSYKSLAAYEEELDMAHFFKIHKSFLINLCHYTAIEEKRTVYLCNGTMSVPISRNYVNPLLDALHERLSIYGKISV